MSLKRIKKQLQIAENSPSEGVGLHKIGQEWLKLQGWIVGPQGTVYEGGLYQIQIILPADYPFKPPKVRFINKYTILTLAKKGTFPVQCSRWSPAFTIETLLRLIRRILAEPNPDDPLVPQIATQYKTQREEYDRIAKQWVQKYA